MEGAGPENLQASLLALGAQIPADPVGEARPRLTGGLIVRAGVVPDQGPEEGVLQAGGLLEQALEDPGVAEHAGEAGHHALWGALPIPGGLDHAVGVGLIFRAEREVLNVPIGEAEVPEVVKAGGTLPLVDKGEEGVVAADGVHVLRLGHAPGEHLGVLPEVEAVVHDVPLEALRVQGAVRHALEKFTVQTVLPDGEAVFHETFGK